MKAFPCIGCGACCRAIPQQLAQHINDPQLDQLVKDADFKFREDGSCVHLVDNKCSIYETRPNICRVDWMAIEYYREVDTPEDLWRHHDFVAVACNILLKNEGKEERVVIEPIKAYIPPSIVRAGKKLHYTSNGMVTLCGYVVKGSWEKLPYAEPSRGTCRACAGLLSAPKVADDI